MFDPELVYGIKLICHTTNKLLSQLNLIQRNIISIYKRVLSASVQIAVCHYVRYY